MPWEKTVGEARPATTATNITAIVFFICLVCVLLVVLKNRRECKEKNPRRLHDPVIRFYDESGTVTETHE